MDNQSYDPFKELGVPYDASKEQVKKAYRKWAKKHHPDINASKPEAQRQSAEEIFKRKTEAYQHILNGYKPPQTHKPETSRSRHQPETTTQAYASYSWSQAPADPCRVQQLKKILAAMGTENGDTFLNAVSAFYDHCDAYPDDIRSCSEEALRALNMRSETEDSLAIVKVLFDVDQHPIDPNLFNEFVKTIWKNADNSLEDRTHQSQIACSIIVTNPEYLSSEVACEIVRTSLKFSKYQFAHDMYSTMKCVNLSAMSKETFEGALKFVVDRPQDSDFRAVQCSLAAAVLQQDASYKTPITQGHIATLYKKYNCEASVEALTAMVFSPQEMQNMLAQPKPKAQPTPSSNAPNAPSNGWTSRLRDFVRRFSKS